MGAPQYLIYGLVDPRTKLVRYVGCSSKGLVRPRAHAHPKTLAKDRTHKANWIRSLLEEGYAYEVVVLERSDRDRIDRDEEWWIAFGRALGWPLTNIKPGGNTSRGWEHSDGTKAKIGAANRGKVRTPETRAKISEGLRNATRKPSEKKRAAALRALASIDDAARERGVAKRRGRRLTDEHKAKAGAAIRALWADPEWRAQSLAGRVGKKRSPETRARMRAAWQRRRGSQSSKPLSDEHRAKLSARSKGRPKSAATRERMRAAQRALRETHRARMQGRTRDSNGRIVKENS